MDPSGLDEGGKDGSWLSRPDSSTQDEVDGCSKTKEKLGSWLSTLKEAY